MSDPKNYTVGWICAVTVEAVAAEVFLDEEHPGPRCVSPNDSNDYTLGRTGEHNVVIAGLPLGEYGTSSATGVAKDMLHSFPNIRIALMVGIGGGAPSDAHDIRLGDVVVSTSFDERGAVFHYDFGKIIQGQEFRPTAFLNKPPRVLLAAVQGLRKKYEIYGHQFDSSIDQVLSKRKKLRKKYQRPPPETDRLYKPDRVHPASHASECEHVCDDGAAIIHRPERDEDDDNPTIHYGLIASSDKLMKDALTRDRLAATGVLCFEMEAAGLMNHGPFLVIRGICDYSDTHKNKRWQGYAAMTAAAYAKDLLYRIPLTQVEAERPLAKTLSDIQTTLQDIHQVTNQSSDAIGSLQSRNSLADIKRWLDPPDCSTNANMARQRRCANTGEWILETAVFREWEAGQRPHLWLHGLAGCGKTVLMSAILDALDREKHPVISSFFFDFNDARKQTLESLLRFMTFELYMLGGKAASILQEVFDNHQQGQRAPDANTLSACLKSMIKATNGVVMTIDALDECTTRNILLLWLEELKICEPTGLKLIVAARPEQEFLDRIPSMFGSSSCFALDEASVEADIRFFVATTLDEDLAFVRKNLSTEIRERILDKLGKGARGMFRWAACQLDSLAECLSPADIDTALASLPLSLSETYDRMLRNISPRHQSKATRLLQFLSHTRRPLTVDEALEVVATDTGGEAPGFDKRKRPFGEAELLRYCPSLVSIIGTPHGSWPTKEIHLAHFSVKEYLLTRDEFSPAEASIVMAKTCLSYLSDIEMDYSNASPFPMANYAANHWMDYSALAQESKDIIQRVIDFLQPEVRFQHWRSMCWFHFGHQLNIISDKKSRLFFMSLFGIVEAARYYLTPGADILGAESDYESALWAAAFSGHYEIVELMLENGVDVNAENKQGWPPLYMAAKQGHRNVVGLLLAHGADVDAGNDPVEDTLNISCRLKSCEIAEALLEKGAGKNRKGSRARALVNAAETGNTEVIRLLCYHGLGVDENHGNFNIALESASRRGHLDIVRYLLSRGVPVNVQEGSWSSPLLAAAERGHCDVIEYLLNNGAEIDMKVGWRGTALRAAAGEGHFDAVQLLLKRGASIEGPDNSALGSPLQAAAQGGRYEVVKLLLQNGAKIDASNRRADTALQSAALEGHYEVVQLLLEQGADVNARCGDSRTALADASLRGHYRIVQLLQGNGANVNAGSPTALECASSRGRSRVVKLLLESKGTDPQGHGYGAAIEEAASHGHQEVVQLLRETRDSATSQKRATSTHPTISTGQAKKRS